MNNLIERAHEEGAIAPSYKRDCEYNTAKLPIRQPLFFTWLIRFLSDMLTIGKDIKIEKVNMDGLKPPYMILSNHMSFIDFEILAKATGWHKINNVVNIDGYYNRPWLMEWIGSICTRKFTTDLHLVKSIKTVLERGDVLCMYPEARYSPAGITSYLPPSLGYLVKRNGVSLVVVKHRGNYLHAPFWNYRQKKNVPFHMTIEQVLTREEIKAMSPAEINAKIAEAFKYDDYRYWQESGFRITESYRAEGMHKILYKCPKCGAEHMGSEGAEVFCHECGKRWTLTETGFLVANEGETEFDHVPDWFLWEREQVRLEIERGEYRYEDEVDVYSMPGCWKFEPLGKARIIHDVNEGFIIEGRYRDADYRVWRKPLEINSLHVEYDFPHVRVADCFDISTEHDSFYCYPTKENVLTKLGFATEIIYEMAEEKRLSARRQGSEQKLG